MPYERLPVLMAEGGVHIAEIYAISRFVSKRVGAYGKNDLVL